jgi:hypothetical protein
MRTVDTQVFRVQKYVQVRLNILADLLDIFGMARHPGF